MRLFRFTSGSADGNVQDMAGHVETRANRVRNVRLALGLSQQQFAAALGVSLESYRPWDSGRRETPDEVVRRAVALTGGSNIDFPIPLSSLSQLLRINEGTLRAAARDGRLRVTTEALTITRRPILRATRAAGRAFKAQYYRQTSRLTQKPAAPDLFCAAPDDFDRQLVALRAKLRISQTELAARIGAAGKAVIYQWESRKRRPTPILWRRVRQLADSSVPCGGAGCGA
jgi:DNA-binding transcriptional regulator YiaG